MKSRHSCGKERRHTACQEQHRHSDQTPSGSQNRPSHNQPKRRKGALSVLAMSNLPRCFTLSVIELEELNRETFELIEIGCRGDSASHLLLFKLLMEWQ